MHPILFTAGGFTLHTFGVMVGLGLVAGIAWCLYAAGRDGVPGEAVVDLCILLVAAGFAGARFLFVGLNAPAFADSFRAHVAAEGLATGVFAGVGELFAVWNGGLVWYGGLLAAFAAALVFLRRRGLPVWSTADLVAPGAMLGLAVGRLGCLAAGDDYGKVVLDALDKQQAGLPPPWWTVTFTDPRSLVPKEMLGSPLYPTQAMMSLNAFAIFLLLLVVRRYRRFPGQVVWVMMAAYAVGRGVIELFRGDAGRGVWFDGAVSTSQIIGAAMLVLSAVMLVYLARVRRTPAPNPS